MKIYQDILKSHKYLIFGISLIFLSLIFGRLGSLPVDHSDEIHDISNRIGKLENKTDKIIYEVYKAIKVKSSNLNLEDFLRMYPDLYQEEGISILVYKNDSLVLWTDNRFSLINTNNIIPNENIAFLANATYMIKKREDHPYKIYGLILMNINSSIENKFLQSYFNPKLKIPNESKISQRPSEGGYIISDAMGSYLFTLQFPTKSYKLLNISAVFILIFAVFLLLTYFSNFNKDKASNKIKLLRIIIAGIFLFSVKLMMAHYYFPDFLYSIVLFKPYIFASSSVLLQSLGDYFIVSAILIFMSYRIHRDVQLNQNSFSNKFINFSVIISICILYYITIYLVNNLLLNSNITLTAHKLTEINNYTILALIAIFFQFTSIFLLLEKFVTKMKKPGLLIFVIICSISVLFISASIITKITYVVFILAISYYIYYIKVIKLKNISFNNFLIYILLFSIQQSIFVYEFSNEKIRNTGKVMAVNLSTEHDPAAEYLITEIDQKLKSDSIFIKLFRNEINQYESLYNYIRESYFDGYWDKYDLSLTVCNHNDSVLIQPGNKQYLCYPFFEKIIQTKGIRIPKTSFFYIDYSNGKITYMGRIRIKRGSENLDRTLYLHLNSRLLYEELGYPDLLIDNKYKKNKSNENSYAKYNNNKLIAQSGKYIYPIDSKVFNTDTSEFSTSNLKNNQHIIFKPDSENLIVISIPENKFIDYLISFSFYSILYFLFFMLYILTTSKVELKSITLNSFKNRIFVSQLGILLASFILVGISIVAFNIYQYKNKHKQIVKEKIKSLHTATTDYIRQIDYQLLKNESFYLQDFESFLIKTSNIFYCDVNIYLPNGQLFASSRPEIFEKGLSGNYMNPVAFYNLKYNTYTEFIHEEQIGEMSYISAYIPLLNNKNETIGYLNLPYFSKQEELTDEITSLIVTVINLYFIIIIFGLIVSIVISNRIAQPLSIIQKRLKEIRPGKVNEKIEYSGNDEIGSLIEDYNRMVDELAENFEKLAKSERESAWREMARQVAHEIKNPLTPMKLSMQQLLRSWSENREDKDEYIKKVSATIIEQIDNLANIATEFSNFAKMPKANYTAINLVEVIEQIMILFNESPHNIEFIIPSSHPVIIYADKEQIQRVFINLITNASQSIPQGKIGKINIHLEETIDTAIVKIEDNGIGIPQNMWEKLFRPNFTTKSGGSGLGLSIVKNIIDQIGGIIKFHSIENKGTIFHIEIPLTESDK